MEIAHVHWAQILFIGLNKYHGVTRYRHTNGPVWWDKYSNNQSYRSITDCSGWVNALLRKSYNYDFEKKMGKIRPYASTYYNAIVNTNNFISINNINNAQIGDFIVIRFPPGLNVSDNTGHIMMIYQLPLSVGNTEPFIIDTIQWNVKIMDQSGVHGLSDSRYKNGNKTTGLGIGYFRIYTDFNGFFTGYSWSTESYSKYVSINVHPFIIGRLQTTD